MDRPNSSKSWDPYTEEDDIIIIVLTRSNVALHVMLATIIQSEPQNASQHCLASLQVRRKIHCLTNSSRSSTICSRSRSQNPSCGPTTVEHEGHRGFSSLTPMSQCIRCRSFQGPFRTGTSCRLQLRMFRRSRPPRLGSTPASIHSVTIHGCVVLTCWYRNILLYILLRGACLVQT